MSMVADTKDTTISTPRPSRAKGALRLVLAYVFVSTFWIVVSNGLIGAADLASGDHAKWHIARDLLFVILTSALLWLLVRRLIADISRTDEQLFNTAEQERQRLNLLLRSLPDPVWLKDASGVFVACNPAMEKFMNRPAEQIVGHTSGDLCPPKMAEEFAATDRIVAETREQFTCCESYPHPDGSTAYFVTTRCPVLDADGHLTAILGIARDVTAEQKAHFELAASEKRFHTLFESATDMIMVADQDARFIDINRNTCETLGYSREELLAMRVTDIQTDASLDELKQMWQSTEIQHGISMHHSLIRKDGSRFQADVRVNLLDLEERNLTMAVVRDVSAQLAAEEQLRASNELNRAIFDATSAQMAVIDTNGDLIAVNASWSRFAEEHSCETDQEPRTGLGSNFFNVCCQDCHPDKDQAQIAVAGVRAVLNGETERFTMESKCATPERMLWFLMNATPLRVGAGGAVITYLDITGIKEAQEIQLRYSQQLQALARKHQEIEEKERLRLSMELHDQIGQSLAALKMSLAQARQRQTETPASATALEQAMNIVDSVAKTTHDISHRLRPPLLDELGIKSALSWHIGNLPCPENVRIRFDDEIGAERFPESVELACFRIIQEALNNALRHAEPTEIKVKIYSTSDHLCLAVEDDGRGFDLDIPLQPNEQWISLGLIGIRERIAQLGGSLQIDSKPNAGTQVSACLPKEIPA